MRIRVYKSITRSDPSLDPASRPRSPALSDWTGSAATSASRMAAVSEAAAEMRRSARAEFTAAFNENRVVLAEFARCNSARELHAVRDRFHLGMAKALCPEEAKAAEAEIGKDGRGAWDKMVASLMSKARFVESDLVSIWDRLEKGRLEWIAAYTATCNIKSNLRAAIEAVDRHRSTRDDLKFALMVWMYATASVIPGDCRDAAVAWAKAVGMQDPRAPLKGFNPEKWSIEAPEWEPLDLALQAAAERAGVELQKAWEADPPQAARQNAANAATAAAVSKD